MKNQSLRPSTQTKGWLLVAIGVFLFLILAVLSVNTRGHYSDFDSLIAWVLNEATYSLGIRLKSLCAICLGMVGMGTLLIILGMGGPRKPGGPVN